MNKTEMQILVGAALEQMARNGASDNYVRQYRNTGFGEILQYFEETGQQEYSSTAIDKFVKRVRNDYENGSVSRWKWGIIRRGAEVLKEFYRTGSMELTKLKRWSLRRLSSEYDELVSRFISDSLKAGALRESTIMETSYCVRQLLFEFEARDLYSFTQITPHVVNECITIVAERYGRGASGLLTCVRRFLKYLKASGIANDDLIKALPQLVSPHRVVRSGYSDSALAKILAEPDRTTDIGKRDYALMLLSSLTGLRRSDVIGLKYENIDWHSNEIRLVQSKTGVASTIPLPVAAGNAIAEYLLNARPKSEEPYVFLTTIAPYRRLKSGCGITNRYVSMANISEEVPERSGFHSFRRAYGKQLLEAETNLDMLSELLGQTHMDSAKPYLSIDEQGLKRCALGLVHTSKGGDVT